MSNIESMSVSSKWKDKFRLLQEAGAEDKFIYQAMQTPEYKSLSFRQKNRITFNTIAFLAGPLYYFFKKMWFKGAFILGASWVFLSLITLVEIVIGFSLPSVIYWIVPAVISSQLANYDYYKKVVHDETMWPGLPSFLSRKPGAIGFPVVSLIILLSLSAFSPAATEIEKEQTLIDVSGVWRADDGGEVVSISLASSRKFISVSGEKRPVTIQSVDLDNKIVTFGINLGGNQVSWSIRQIFNSQGSFTLEITLHDGSQEGLSFIRGL